MLHLALLASLALAAPNRRPPSLDLGLAAELPVSTGIMATLELPGRLRLGGGIGHLPGLLAYGAGEAAASWGWLDAESAAAVGEELGSAWVFAAYAGWRPFARSGLWLAGDLRRLRVSTEAELPVLGTDGAPASLAMDLRLTLLGGSMGWDWVLGDHVTLRLYGGLLALRHSATELDPSGDAAVAERAAADAAARLDALLSRGLMVPTLGLGLGWHFGGERSAGS
ncbi:MAG: hypothetical protein ABIO70_26920 [Pseudomonadota bacterium]